MTNLFYTTVIYLEQKTFRTDKFKLKYLPTQTNQAVYQITLYEIHEKSCACASRMYIVHRKVYV